MQEQGLTLQVISLSFKQKMKQKKYEVERWKEQMRYVSCFMKKTSSMNSKKWSSKVLYILSLSESLATRLQRLAEEVFHRNNMPFAYIHTESLSGTAVIWVRYSRFAVSRQIIDSLFRWYEYKDKWTCHMFPYHSCWDKFFETKLNTSKMYIYFPSIKSLNNLLLSKLCNFF